MVRHWIEQGILSQLKTKLKQLIGNAYVYLTYQLQTNGLQRANMANHALTYKVSKEEIISCHSPS